MMVFYVIRLDRPERAETDMERDKSDVYALASYKRIENSYSFGVGLADTIVAQEVRSCCIKNGNVVFEESLSKSSMVGIAVRNIQKEKKL